MSIQASPTRSQLLSKVMSWRFGLRKLALGFLVLTISSVAHGEGGDQAAETYIQQMSDQAYHILNHKDLDAAGRAEAFRGLVRTSFDFQRIGMFALAKHRRQASREDVVTFLRAFENYAINIYQSRLSEYSGERLKVTGSMIRKETVKAREVIVAAKISFSDGSPPWDVNWRVYARDGKYQVVDVQVAGIWMALEQRSQFSSIIQREKGSVAALTEILQEKAGATADL